jgi:hypothetical protein
MWHVLNVYRGCEVVRSRVRYEAQRADELALSEGDRVEVTARMIDGWLSGSVERISYISNSRSKGCNQKLGCVGEDFVYLE